MLRNSIVHLGAIGLSGALGMACTSYMPIADDEEVVLVVEGQRSPPADGEDQQFNALAAACFRKIEGRDLCGQRIVPAGYDPDEIFVNDMPLEDVPVDHILYEGISSAVYGANLTHALPGEEFELTVNEFDVSTLTMPQRLRIDIDVAETIIELSKTSGISLQWEPPPRPDLPDKIDWFIEVGTADHPCVDVDIPPFGAEIDDQIPAVLSLEDIPKNVLPANGCTATLYVRRVRYGRLNPEIKNGIIRGQQTDSREILIKP